MNNFETVREGLTAEINALAAEVRDLNLQIDGLKSHVKSRQVAMGIKLLALREMAFEAYGERRTGALGPDGRRAPNNWPGVCEQAGVRTQYASACMRIARNPEKMFDRDRAYAAKSRATDSFKRVLTYLHKLLPYMTYDEKVRCMTTIHNSIKSHQEAA